MLWAKVLGLAGSLLLTIPVIWEGRRHLLFRELGARTRDAQLKQAIAQLKEIEAGYQLSIKRRDVLLFQVGLAMVVASFACEVILLI